MTPLELQVEPVDAESKHVLRRLPVLVLMPHNRCNCRCLMCDIWRIRQTREITDADLAPHIAGLRELKVQWVVFSGGEPLMHSNLWPLVRMLRCEQIRTTLLTAGLLLEKFAAQVAEDFDDVIVSLDGPPEVHDRIRGVPGTFRRLECGIQAVRGRRPFMPIHARCTIQKHNVRHLRAVVDSALQLNLNSISFLAADASSIAFNHEPPVISDSLTEYLPGLEDIESLSQELDRLILDYPQLIQSGFVRESPEKLRCIESHFRANLGQIHFRAPRCNAPWVSAVIEADGTVRPCFFHQPIGNIQHGALVDILNGRNAMQFRGRLDVSTDPICQKCVCSLFLDEGTPGRNPQNSGKSERICQL